MCFYYSNASLKIYKCVKRSGIHIKSIQTNLLNMSKKPTVHYSTWDTLRNEEMLKLTAYMKSTSQNQGI